MKHGFMDNIEELTLANEYFRKVLYTSAHAQLVLMALKPGEDIGMEAHADNDQFFRIEQGQAKVVIDGNECMVSDGFAVLVPAGSQHNISNISQAEMLKFYTIYSPAHHRDGVAHETKEQAQADSESYDGKNTE